MAALIGDIPSPVHAYVGQLQGLVDQLTAPLLEAHAARLRCRLGCTDCCSDGLTVFEVEAAQILENVDAATLSEGPEGGCALLDSTGACQAYRGRPYVCRTQGLPLRWGADGVDGPVEHRDICPLNEGEPALEALPADACWTLGPVEQRLAHAQRQAQSARGDEEDAPLRRVSLRALVRSVCAG